MVYSICLRVTPACVWCCDASTFTEHEKHQTSNLNMKYSGEYNKRQCPDHRQTFAANRQRSRARGMPLDVNCFITRPKPLRNLPPPYKLRFRTGLKKNQSKNPPTQNIYIYIYFFILTKKRKEKEKNINEEK